MIHFFFGSPRRRDVTRELSIDPPLPSLEQGRRGGGWHVQTHASAKIASAARKSPPSLFSPFPSRIYLYLQIDFFYYIYIYSISPLPHHHHHLSTVCVCLLCADAGSRGFLSVSPALQFPSGAKDGRRRVCSNLFFLKLKLLLLLLLTKIRTSACCLNVAGQRFVGYG